jgi:hypothetical protein
LSRNVTSKLWAEHIPLCGNRFLHFSYMHASQAYLEALYRI